MNSQYTRLGSPDDSSSVLNNTRSNSIISANVNPYNAPTSNYSFHNLVNFLRDIATCPEYSGVPSF